MVQALHMELCACHATKGREEAGIRPTESTLWAGTVHGAVHVEGCAVHNSQGPGLVMHEVQGTRIVSSVVAGTQGSSFVAEGSHDLW